MDPGTTTSGELPPPAISQADDDDGARVDVASQAEEAAGDDHLPDPYLFEILKNAGVEIDDEMATDIRDEIARIKAEGAREAAVISKSAGGNNILRRFIKGAATGVGYVLVQSACACAGIVIFLGIMAAIANPPQRPRAR